MPAEPPDPQEQLLRREVIEQSVHDIDVAVSEAKARMAQAASARLGIGERAREAFESSLLEIEHFTQDSREALELDPDETDQRRRRVAPADRSNTRPADAKRQPRKVRAAPLRLVRVGALAIAFAPLVIAGPAYVVARVDAFSLFLWRLLPRGSAAIGGTGGSPVAAAPANRVLEGNGPRGDRAVRATIEPSPSVDTMDLQAFAAPFSAPGGFPASGILGAPARPPAPPGLDNTSDLQSFAATFPPAREPPTADPSAPVARH
jgi:hypothetical protein